MAGVSWRELDEQRQSLPKPLSRAAWARLSGLSESTITKGVKEDKRPRKEQREQAKLVLEAHRHKVEAGL